MIQEIVREIINEVLPDEAVRKALRGKEFTRPLFLIGIGKAAWEMSATAVEELGKRIAGGIVVTKYHHSKGEIANLEIIESGHPVPDENSVRAARRILELVGGLTEETEIILLISGGGSALVELPAEGLALEDFQKITEELLHSGADITKINLIRKKLSDIKGGRLAQELSPHHVYSVILSDVVGNHPEMIASGMTYPDTSSAEDARQVLRENNISMNEAVQKCLMRRPVRELPHVENEITGSVEQLCIAAKHCVAARGYQPYILDTALDGEAREVGKWMVDQALNGNYERPCALIAGGETIVRVKGNGLGGRNQEIALSAAIELAGREGMLLFSLGSDGTDGPTDAAGGVVDGNTVGRMRAAGVDPQAYLDNNDAYHALEKADALLLTGPTGTNVNDVTVLLMK